MTERHPAVLVLEDGTVYHGKAIGKRGRTSGELAFNTGMTGYQEVFTDPSYLEQLLIMNASHIGNYGVHPQESESERMQVAGVIIKKFSEVASRTSADASLEEFMLKNEKVGIAELDTRALVRHIRDRGAMNAIISSEEELNIKQLKVDVKSVPSMEGLELSSRVSTKVAYESKSTSVSSNFKVALLDLGVKRNITRCLNERGCDVMVFPMTSTLAEMKAYNPDGFMLSNGPGDPAAMGPTHQLVAEIIATGKPVFGICMGHQVIALSQGLKTEKMHHGHRGLNHPIKNLITGKGEITSQNHGFVVSKDSVENHPNIDVTHLHLNDGTIAGIAFKDKPVFSVQYHPEASAGPHDSRYLFDQFIDTMKKYRS
ncbi:MAG: glutamine-hydrolyzing carbamoyl-phosphate synthase small subunit [Crocinitomicaceae bacterium]|nr:glutamine-hydrolyzing carbamoyl-phosphate synthase small subunit [Crocinitomicaceae bacterium]